MKTEKKLMGIVFFCLLCGTPAQAQLGGLLKKAKAKVEEKAKEKKKEVVQKAEARSKGLENDEYEKEKGVIGIRTDDPLYNGAYKTTDWEFLQSCEWKGMVNGELQPLNNSKDIEKNALYYLYRIEKATKEKNLEKMLGENQERMIWLYNELANRAKTIAHFYDIDYDGYKKRFGTVLEDWKKVVWDGSTPTKIDYKDRKEHFEEYRDERYDSYIWLTKRAAETKNAAKEYYLKMAMDFREMLIGDGTFKPTDTKYAVLEKGIKDVLAQTSETFRQQHPYRSPETVMAEKKEREAQWAREKAKKEQERAAAIAANTKSWPKSNMGNAALLASCVKAIKAQWPDEDPRRVSIINTSWQIDRNAFGAIIRRRVAAWVDCKGEGGKRMAKCFGFSQDYVGGGKYGNTKFFGTGTQRPFYIQ